MSDLPEPPEVHDTFTAVFPELGKAWELVGKAGRDGPLDARTARLVKLAVAIGAQQEGAVHASVRKALALGISREELNQVVALAAGTLGFPRTVAAFTWIQDLL
jgi:alkylhydroperoxidase/carboxymuconolactone decarboxylase family protein YurZ